MVDRGNHVVQEFRIVFVAEDAFLEDGLVVEMKRQAGCVVSAGALEGAARFHFEHVIDAVAVLINPSTDRVARISRSGVEVRGPVAPIGVDSTKRLSAARRDIGGFRRYDEFHGSKSDSHERHAARHAANGMVKKIALSAVGTSVNSIWLGSTPCALKKMCMACLRRV